MGQGEIRFQKPFLWESCLEYYSRSWESRVREGDRAWDGRGTSDLGVCKQWKELERVSLEKRRVSGET